jgi:hypothetical protein
MISIGIDFRCYDFAAGGASSAPTLTPGGAAAKPGTHSERERAETPPLSALPVARVKPVHLPVATRRGASSWIVPAFFGVGLMLGAWAAHAETRRAWGGYGDGWAEITPADGAGGHVATVTLHNVLTGGHDSEMTFALTVDGIAASVTVDHLPGDIPDTIDVLVGPDFVAIPPHLDVPEGVDGMIRIYRRSDMVTG